MHVIARLPLLLVAFALAWAGLAPGLPAAGQETPAVESPAAAPDQEAQQIQGDLQVQGDVQIEGDQQVQGNQVVTDDATAIALDPAMVLALVLVLLLIALFALSEIFRYLRDGREDYYKTFREFARKGVYVEPVMVNATAAQAAPAIRDANGTIQESSQLPTLFRISGPGVIVAGVPGAFRAFLDDQPAPGTTWALTAPDGSAVPAESATVTPVTGAATTVAAARPGTYVLTATPDAAQGLSVRVQSTITAVEPPAADGDVPRLPFIGEGYGSIVGAILLLAVVVVLAAARAIDADVIGVLLGSIAGFLFGVGVARTSS